MIHLLFNPLLFFFSSQARLQAGWRAQAGGFTRFIFLPALHRGGGGVVGGEGHRRDVEVMDPSVLRVPGTAARYEGRSRRRRYITPREPPWRGGGGGGEPSVEMLMLIYQDGLGCLH